MIRYTQILAHSNDHDHLFNDRNKKKKGKKMIWKWIKINIKKCVWMCAYAVLKKNRQWRASSFARFFLYFSIHAELRALKKQQHQDYVFRNRREKEKTNKSIWIFVIFCLCFSFWVCKLARHYLLDLFFFSFHSMLLLLGVHLLNITKRKKIFYA